ncbi:MAG: helix-turn-helix domain-containing protein [Candidatus Omnitrophota bacterium]
MMVSEIKEYFLTREKGKVFRSAINDTERILIEEALKRSRGNQVDAARILGVNRNTIRTKIRKLQIGTTSYKL